MVSSSLDLVVESKVGDAGFNQTGVVLGADIENLVHSPSQVDYYATPHSGRCTAVAHWYHWISIWLPSWYVANDMHTVSTHRNGEDWNLVFVRPENYLLNFFSAPRIYHCRWNQLFIVYNCHHVMRIRIYPCKLELNVIDHLSTHVPYTCITRR